MKIYVASSWRNKWQQLVVQYLREQGFEVYDFKNPRAGDSGFHWSEIDPEWKSWDADRFIQALHHPIADSGFASDFEAMKSADACVLVLPCGRSAHLEAGWFCGAGKPVHIILFGYNEPELMYKCATGCHEDIDSVVRALRDARQG